MCSIPSSSSWARSSVSKAMVSVSAGLEKLRALTELGVGTSVVQRVFKDAGKNDIGHSAKSGAPNDEVIECYSPKVENAMSP